MNCLPIRDSGRVTRAKGAMPQHEFIPIVRRWFEQKALEALECAVALRALWSYEASAAWAEIGLGLAAKCWLTEFGETYVDITNKWLPAQLNRVDAPASICERIKRMRSSAHSGLGAKAFVEAAVSLSNELMGTELDHRGIRIRLERSREVTTWRIAGRLHVVHKKTHVYVLRDDAGEVWTRLRFARPLPLALPVRTACVGQLVAEFHRLGLVRLRGSRGHVIDVRGVVARPPTIGQPMVTLKGIPLDGRTVEAIRSNGMPARLFASVGLAMGWANMEIENAREDAEGAAAEAQWGVFERAARRMIAEASVLLLCAHGVFPRPKLHEAISMVATLRTGRGMLASTLTRLDATICVRSAEEAAALLLEIDAAVESVRRFAQSPFPRCFDSAEEWQNAIDIGHGWGRLGAFVGAVMPAVGLRDLVGAGGMQPYVR